MYCWFKFFKSQWIINKSKLGEGRGMKKNLEVGADETSVHGWNMSNPIEQSTFFFLLNNIDENELYIFSRLSCQACSKG